MGQIAFPYSDCLTMLTRFTLLLSVLLLRFGACHGADRPNILWITAEDMSPHLGCYGDEYATTPNIDNLAGQSIRFTAAFATNPVCSPSRSCLITGVYATSLGTQRLRSSFPLPAHVRGFPSFLREAGYFTSNNVKTDYNVQDRAGLIEQSWHRSAADAHWRQRQPGQPFFCVFNLMTTHQSRTSVWSFDEFEQQVGSRLDADLRHDPAQVPLPPYYPDTPLVRRTMARYYDCITRMDQQVGELLEQLRVDGLEDETIVFFYSDHGMGMPRGKRLLHDSGMRVPLLVRFPPKFRHLAPSAPGTTTDRLVSFVDFPPTVLNLASVEIPAYMQGHAFLGRDGGSPRRYVFGARDRVDEADDVSRSVRDKRFLYIRNFMPHHSWLPPEGYSGQSEMRREFLCLRREGRLSDTVMASAAWRKPIEELYDVEQDPHQINNLVNSSRHRQRLTTYRSALRDWMHETRDLGLLPESLVWQLTDGGAPWTLRDDASKYSFPRLFAVADVVGRPNQQAAQTQHLTHNDPAVRYWAAVGLRAAETWSESAQAALTSALSDPIAAVRIEAAAALLGHHRSEEAVNVLTTALGSSNPDIVLPAMRVLELAGTKSDDIRADKIRSVVESVLVRAQQGEARQEHDCWMFVRFSAEAFLAQVGSG